MALQGQSPGTTKEQPPLVCKHPALFPQLSRQTAGRYLTSRGFAVILFLSSNQHLNTYNQGTTAHFIVLPYPFVTLTGTTSGHTSPFQIPGSRARPLSDSGSRARPLSDSGSRAPPLSGSQVQIPSFHASSQPIFFRPDRVSQPRCSSGYTFGLLPCRPKKSSAALDA